MQRKPGVVHGVVLAVAILASAVQAQITGGGLVGTAPGFAAATRSVTSTATITAIDLASRR
jgi:Na+/H+-dicarboxylate symporter